MEREELESKLIDYIDGNMVGEELKWIESEIRSKADVNKTYEQLKKVITAIDQSASLVPTPDLRNQFDTMLRQQKGLSLGKTIFLNPMVYRIAAALVILMGGVGIGFWVNKSQEHEKELAELRHQVEENKQLMMSMLGNRLSASQRVLGATAAFNMDKTDNEIVKALVQTMNEDPNTNVRMAAMEALGKFYSETDVRRALIYSLSIQKDPVVQLALIRLLVEMKEKDAVHELKRITEDEEMMPAVKDEAHTGILKLS